ncbi:hypothetical protein F1880_007807, partial [Penicillium rolfsii]
PDAAENITRIRPLAQSIYKSLFNASDLFTPFRDELGLLVSLLIVTEEHAPIFRPDDPQLSEFDNVLTDCYDVLQDLVRLKEQFNNIDTQRQVTRERMGWGVDELAEIRGKLSLHIQVLNFLITRTLRSSHEHVQRMLEIFIGEVRGGKRKIAAISCVSAGSLTVDEKEAWRMVRKELQSIGITRYLFTQHRQLILKSLEDFVTQGDITDLHKNLEAEETEIVSETAVIKQGRQLDNPATGSGVEPKKRLNIMTSLVSRITRLTGQNTTAPLRYQHHGVCMVCLEDIEVPDPLTLASLSGKHVPKDLPTYLIHWQYMATDCEHTFHIHCWEQSMEFPLRCPICNQLIS